MNARNRIVGALVLGPLTVEQLALMLCIREGGLRRELLALRQDGVVAYQAISPQERQRFKGGSYRLVQPYIPPANKHSRKDPA